MIKSMKPLINYENKYSIAEDGIIISHPKIYGFGLHKEKVMKFTVQNGYHAVRLGRGNHNFHYVHRLVALVFLEKKHGEDFINHKDGNKLNNHYTNLEWCTNLQNINHAWENGLSCKRKISDDEVNQIRELRDNGVSYKDIASKFDIRRETASNIVNRKFRFGGDKDDTGSTSEIERITSCS